VTSDEAYASCAEQGIHLLRLPTPFMIGRTNCYLIEDDPLTLIDTGANSGKGLDELEHQLDDLGHRIEDLELVIITHQHIDHIGLAEVIASRSSAEVASIDVAVDLLSNFGENAEADDQFAASLMLGQGVPEDVVTALQSVSRSFRAWGSRPKVTRPLADGEILRLRDRTLEVQHRPGHSPSDTLFWDSERRILFAADHLIKDVSSNALITPPLDGSGERPQALVAYIASMRRTRELPAEIVLSGHGDAITDHVALIDERFERHRKRARRIHELLAEQPRTGYEIAQELWGNIAVTQAFLTTSEVIGHLDLLVNAGRVSETSENGVSRWEAVGEGPLGEVVIADAPRSTRR
jgi:glyoxylase-like metal-dependent hydrolase (beta-lactamase superfamily II)